jgi:hypothetical protein
MFTREEYIVLMTFLFEICCANNMTGEKPYNAQCGIWSTFRHDLTVHRRIWELIAKMHMVEVANSVHRRLH